MMHCADFREAAANGGAPADTEEGRAHLARCAACREAPPAPSSTVSFDTLYARVSQEVDHERGPAAWLRSRSTPVRYGLAAGGVVMLAGAMLARKARADLWTLPASNIAFALIALGAAVALAASTLLRPLHRPPQGARPRLAAGVALVTAPLVVALLPGLAPDGLGSGLRLPSLGSLEAASTASCFVHGLVVAAPVALLWWLLDRAAIGPTTRAVLIAGAGGAVANVLLYLQCASRAPAHLVGGHASVSWALVAIAMIAARYRLRHFSRQ